MVVGSERRLKCKGWVRKSMWLAKLEVEVQRMEEMILEGRQG